jgi:hypothetical protein
MILGRIKNMAAVMNEGEMIVVQILKLALARKGRKQVKLNLLHHEGVPVRWRDVTPVAASPAYDLAETA